MWRCKFPHTLAGMEVFFFYTDGLANSAATLEAQKKKKEELMKKYNIQVRSNL